MISKTENGTVFSKSTGEVLQENTVYTASDEVIKVIKKSAVKQFEPVEKVIEWKRNESFIKLYPEYAQRIALILNESELKIMFSVIQYVDYKSCMLMFGKRPLKNSDIEQITKLSHRAVSFATDGLVKKKIFARVKVGLAFQYIANPYLFIKGKYINETLIAMFKNYDKYLDLIGG